MCDNLEEACIVLAMRTVVIDRPILEKGNTLHSSASGYSIENVNWLARSLSLLYAQLRTRTTPVAAIVASDSPENTCRFVAVRLG